MGRPELGRAVFGAREGFVGGMPEAVDERLRARLSGTGQRRRRVRWGRVAAVAAALLAVASTGALVREGPAPDRLAGFTVEARSALCVASAAGDQVALSAGRLVLADRERGARLELEAPAVLRRLEGGVELRHGTVTVELATSLARSAAYTVQVSSGVIELDGGRATFEQRAGYGLVTLLEGRAGFETEAGERRELFSDEPLRWPLAARAAQGAMAPEPAPAAVPSPRPRRPEPPPPSPAPAPPSPAPAAFDVAGLLERIATLRSRGQFEQAIVELQRELEPGHGAGTDERLSFELGAILTRQLGDAPRACAHWQRHQRRFPGGRYSREVAQAQGELECRGAP